MTGPFSEMHMLAGARRMLKVRARVKMWKVSKCLRQSAACRDESTVGFWTTWGLYKG